MTIHFDFATFLLGLFAPHAAGAGQAATQWLTQRALNPGQKFDAAADRALHLPSGSTAAAVRTIGQVAAGAIETQAGSAIVKAVPAAAPVVSIVLQHAGPVPAVTTSAPVADNSLTDLPSPVGGPDPTAVQP